MFPNRLQTSPPKMIPSRYRVFDVPIYKAKVTRVVDGDTIDVDIDLGFDLTLKQRLRLYGINTPEIRSRDPIEKASGLKSKKFLANELKKSDNVIDIKVHGTGKFGRPLVEIYIGSLNINQLLIENGYAVPYFGGKKV